MKKNTMKKTLCGVLAAAAAIGAVGTAPVYAASAGPVTLAAENAEDCISAGEVIGEVVEFVTGAFDWIVGKVTTLTGSGSDTDTDTDSDPEPRYGTDDPDPVAPAPQDPEDLYAEVLEQYMDACARPAEDWVNEPAKLSEEYPLVNRYALTECFAQQFGLKGESGWGSGTDHKIGYAFVDIDENGTEELYIGMDRGNGWFGIGLFGWDGSSVVPIVDPNLCCADCVDTVTLGLYREGQTAIVGLCSGDLSACVLSADGITLENYDPKDWDALEETDDELEWRVLLCEAPDELKLTGWKQAYLDYLTEKEPTLDAYSFEARFVYIDDDDIPELVVSDGYYVTGTDVVSWDGSAVTVQVMQEVMVPSDRSGKLVSRSMHMGAGSDIVYSLENGRFTEIGGGCFNYDSCGSEDEYTCWWGNYTQSGSPISYDEYMEKMGELVDIDSLSDVICSRDDIDWTAQQSIEPKLQVQYDMIGLEWYLLNF